MFKKGFWKLEYSITLFFLLGLFMLIVPIRLENYLQAGLISKWTDKYDKAAYMLNVIRAQVNDEILKSFAQAETSAQREKLLLQLVKPYLRITKTDKFPRRYKPKYMIGKRVSKNDFYYFSDLYFSDNGRQIVGIKDIADNDATSAWFMIMFDLNGMLPPNTWGKDIFGIYIYDRGAIEAFGYDKTLEELIQDCSSEGSGVYCSYYYSIGGAFND